MQKLREIYCSIAEFYDMSISHAKRNLEQEEMRFFQEDNASLIEQYDSHFTDEDKVFLASLNIEPKIANSFSQCNLYDLYVYDHLRITYNEILQRPDCLTVDEYTELKANRIDPQEATAYCNNEPVSERFMTWLKQEYVTDLLTEDELGELNSKDINPEEAIAYANNEPVSERFMAWVDGKEIPPRHYYPRPAQKKPENTLSAEKINSLETILREKIEGMESVNENLLFFDYEQLEKIPDVDLSLHTLADYIIYFQYAKEHRKRYMSEFQEMKHDLLNLQKAESYQDSILEALYKYYTMPEIPDFVSWLEASPEDKQSLKLQFPKQYTEDLTEINELLKGLFERRLQLILSDEFHQFYQQYNHIDNLFEEILDESLDPDADIPNAIRLMQSASEKGYELHFSERTSRHRDPDSDGFDRDGFYEEKHSGIRATLKLARHLDEKDFLTILDAFENYKTYVRYGDAPKVVNYETLAEDLCKGHLPKAAMPVLLTALKNKLSQEQYHNPVHALGEDIIGFGAEGCVIKEPMEGKITKFFYDPENIEFKHHQLLSNTKNIPQCLKVDKTKNALEIEYIEGVDLDDLFERYHYFHEFGNLGFHFNAAFTYVYCYDLLNAVEELAHKNLHHRDIHQKNVRISLENKAYLLDMGISTTSRTDMHPLNRSCGGNNDLISIGQLAHIMRTGKNPFEPKSKSNRSNRWNIVWNNTNLQDLTINQRKNNIQQRRNRVYHNGHVNPN
ncbi:MAG: hypothetical protein R6V53_02920, partial [Candidatus Woesearchaeota archaeon]